MGKPNFEWKKIPLSKDMDNKNLKIKIRSIDGNQIIGGFSLSVGNPHIIFFVKDFDKFKKFMNLFILNLSLFFIPKFKLFIF